MSGAEREEHRSRLEAALREGEERFAAVAETLPVLIWVSDEGMGCIYLNPAWLDYTGSTLERELGDGWARGLHADDIERYWDTFREAFDRREPYEMEYRLRRADGTYGVILERGAPRHAPDGSFLGFVGGCVDVTAQRDSQRRLRDANTRLSDTAEELRRDRDRRAEAIAALQDGFYVTDAAGTMLEANERFCAIVGLSMSELIGTAPPYPWWPSDPQERERLMSAVVRAIERHEAIDEIELHARRPDGEVVHGLLTLAPLHDRGGAVEGLVGTLKDVGDRYVADERVRRLETLNESLGRAETVDQVLDVIMWEGGRRATEADVGTLSVPDPATASLRMVRQGGEAEPWSMMAQVSLDADNPIAEAYRTGTPAFFRDRAMFLDRYPSLAGLSRIERFEARATLPLVGRERPGAVLHLAFETSCEFDLGMRSFFVAIGERCGVALERTALLEATMRAEDRTRRLQSLTAALSGSATTREIAGTLLEQGLRSAGVDGGRIAFLSPDHSRLRFPRIEGTDGDPRQLEGELDIEVDDPVAEAVRTRGPVYVESRVALLDRYPGLPSERDEAGVDAQACLPLVADTTLGAIVLTSTAPRRFDEDERAFLEAVAAQCAQALQRSAHLEASSRALERVAALQGVTEGLAAAGDLRSIGDVVVERGLGLFDAVEGFVAVVGNDGVLRIVAGTELQGAIARGDGADVASPPAMEAVRTSSPLFLTSRAIVARLDPELAGSFRSVRHAAAAIHPVVVDGRTTACIGLYFAEPREFDRDERDLLVTLARQCGDAMSRASAFEAESEARRRAEHEQRRTRRLQVLTSRLSGARTPDEVSAVALEEGLEAVNAIGGAVLRIDRGGAGLRVLRSIGDEGRLAEVASIPLDPSSPVARVARGGPAMMHHGPDPGVAWTSEIVVPLSPADGPGGVLVAGFAPDHAVPPEDVTLLETVGSQVGQAIERAAAYEAEAGTRVGLERAVGRLARLQRATATLTAQLDPEQVSQTVLEEAVAALNADGGLLFVPGSDRSLVMAARAGFATHDAWTGLGPFSVDAPFSMSEAYRTGHMVWVPNRRDWQSRFPEGFARFEGQARSALSVPLVFDDRTLGVIALLFAKDDTLNREDRRLARTFGEQAAQALERTRLLAEERRTANRIAQIQTATAALAAAVEPEEIARATIELAIPAIGGRAGAMGVLGDDGRMLDVISHAGYREGAVDAWESFPIDVDMPAARAVRDRRPVFLGTKRDIVEAFPSLQRYVVEVGDDAWASLPLMVGPRVIGFLHVNFRTEQAFDLQQRMELVTLAAQVAQALDRARLHVLEHEVARTLQRSMLPTPPATAGRVLVATRYEPGSDELEVGGDWFEVASLPRGSVALAVGDVVGRGLEAAATMGQLRSALRALALQGGGPGSVLEGLDAFAASTPDTRMATVAYAEIDPANGTLRYACAGHPPPMLIRDGLVHVLDAGRSPLLAAIPEQRSRQEAEVPLRVGDLLFLYTDGLIERRGESFDDGLARLIGTLEEIGSGDPQTVCDGALRALVHGGTHDDDVALLAARYEPRLEPSHFRSFPARPEVLSEVRRQLRGWLEGHVPDREVVDDIILAAGEAAANAIEHAYIDGSEGSIDVEFGSDGSEVILRIRHWGRWREAKGDPDRGRGLVIIQGLMDDVMLTPDEGGTTVTMRRKLTEGARP